MAERDESGSQTKILVVDDDPRLLRLVSANLTQEGYEVVTARDGIEGTTSAAREQPNLAIIDVMMPGRDGFETTTAIRAFSDMPIILLTARGEQADKVRGLDAGADDYMTKPFGIAEFLARVRSVLRRAQPAEAGDTMIDVGTLHIDTARHEVSVRAEPVKVTPTEYRLLVALAAQPDVVHYHEDLLEGVWGPEYRDEHEYLWAYIRYLRRKLEADPAEPRIILTEPGVGYRIVAA